MLRCLVKISKNHDAAISMLKFAKVLDTFSVFKEFHPAPSSPIILQFPFQGEICKHCGEKDKVLITDIFQSFKLFGL